MPTPKVNTTQETQETSGLPEVIINIPTAADLKAQEADNSVIFETDVAQAKSVENVNGTTVVRW